MRVATVAVILASVVAVSASSAAPPRRLVMIGCEGAAPPPAAAVSSTGPNLTLGTVTLARLARLADPVGFRRFRKGSVYRIPIYARAAGDQPTVAARGSTGNASFSFAPKWLSARAVTFACSPGLDGRIGAFYRGAVIVPKPGCYTFAVSIGGDVFRRSVPLGVARHCA